MTTLHTTPIGADDLARARSLRDLCDPNLGPHAMQTLLERIRLGLASMWDCASIRHRADPVVRIEDNYDRLGYAPDAVTRDARYSRYVSRELLLRTHTSAMIPPLLASLAAEPPADVLLVCAGLVYRRDAIDRLHTGEPHQADVWRIAAKRLTTSDLSDMVACVVSSALPGWTWRVTPADHPYTTDGLQIDVCVAGPAERWVEIGECGLAHPNVLAGSGLDTRVYSGLAMGLGLDRLVMLAKGIDDIRLLRATDERIASQMLDLAPYRPVSSQPPIRRDLSLMIAAGDQAEDIGDRIRESLGEEANRIESVELLSETDYAALPLAAIERMGARPGQKNVLVRLVIRDVDRTLSSEEANGIRNRVYRALHAGGRAEWA